MKAVPLFSSFALLLLLGSSGNLLARNGAPSDEARASRYTPSTLSAAIKAELGDRKEWTTKSLLDNFGHMESKPKPSLIRFWRSSVHSASDPTVSAPYRLWLGEYEMSAEENLDEARYQLNSVVASSKRGTNAEYLASLDLAIIDMFRGAEDAAVSAFSTLRKRPNLSPGQKMTLNFWIRRSSMIQGYHAAHAKIGIPEPPALDNLCVASGLAICLRKLGMQHDKGYLLSKLHHTGYGSSGQDVINACEKLGLIALPIGVTEQGLKDLPKPLIAFVEHDHFITVLDANSKGVSYLCSDCGPWPGGEVNLTWKQWKAMDASGFLSVQKKNSVTAMEISEATKLHSHIGTKGLVASLGAQNFNSRAAQTAILWARNVSVSYNTPFDNCGYPHMPMSTYPAPGQTSVPHYTPAMADDNCHCAVQGDPVNLATGAEEYSPDPDITVYNPTGPSVSFARTYGSLRGVPETGTNAHNALYYGWNLTDFLSPWAQNYDMDVYDPSVGNDVIANPTVAKIVRTDSNDAPASGTWDVVLSGSPVASSGTPNGWTVTGTNASSATVTPPSSATVATGYELRWTYSSADYSSHFDVVGLTQIPADNIGAVTITGSDPSIGTTWQVVYGGTVVGSSAQTNGWMVPSYSSTTITVTVPRTAAVGSGYEVKLNTPTSISATFSVIAERGTYSAGTKYLTMPNGSEVTFSMASVPTSGSPVTGTITGGGVPMIIQWFYSSTDEAGYYLVTFADQSKWMFTGAQRSSGSSWLNYIPTKIYDRVNNAITLGYSYAWIGGFWKPELMSFTDVNSGTTLLSITRDPSTGRITALNDCYSRTISYSYTYLGLQMVSQPLSSGGTVDSANMRWTYGYYEPSGFGYYVLQTIQVPNPNGSGTPAEITYSYNSSGFLSSITDANGNVTTFTATGSNETKVTLTPPTGTIFYYWVTFDNLENETAYIDANSVAVWTETFADPNDPYKPSSHQDDTYTTSFAYTWDQYGNIQTSTTPRGTETVYGWNYSFLPGLISSVQEGSKTATTIDYNSNSTLEDVKSPIPGTSGGSTQTTTYTTARFTAKRTVISIESGR